MPELNLIQKIAKAALDVGGKLSADKTNKEQAYDYISADKILSICGQALFAQGVMILPEILSQEVTNFEYIDRYDKKRNRFDAVVTFNFTITDGVSMPVSANWTGRGGDYTIPDKALYKAITSGHKYFLMKLLSVGAGNEDSEHETTEEVKQVAAPKNGKAEAPAAPAPEMTLEQAMAVKSSKGETYGSLDDETLSYMTGELIKSLKKNPGDPERTRKLAAARLILSSRTPEPEMDEEPTM